MKIKQVLALAITSIILLAGCSTKSNTANSIPVKTIQGSFAINRDNKNELVGDADYVFVAFVNSQEGTIYKDPVSRGMKVFASPYTKYNITVIDNIKGNLKKDTELEIQKFGGLSKDGREYYICEADELPTLGKYYIIAAYAQPDGSLLISGPNSNKLLKAANKNDILSSEDYKQYKAAEKNQVKNDRKRFISKYEE